MAHQAVRDEQLRMVERGLLKAHSLVGEGHEKRQQGRFSSAVRPKIDMSTISVPSSVSIPS
ncbi:MAG: hypothetical protein U0361_23515 [Nitrospiraceae bacterium]